MLTAIRKWVVQTMMKSKSQTGVVQNLPKRDLIEMNVQITAERLMRNGVDPNELKNANQVENAINSIENRPLPAQEGIRSTKSAKVFDIDGNLIDPSKGIIGGKQMKPIKQGEAITSENFGSSQFAPDNQYGFGRDRKTLEKELMKTDNPFSDLVKTTNQKPKSLKEREAEVLARMEKDNKAAVQRIKNRKMLDDAVDNASPGFVKGDRKYNAQLVADDLAEKKFGKDFYDLDQKQQMDLYGEALDGLSDSKNLERQFMKDVDEAGGMEEFLNKNPIDDPEDFAQGGRAGFKGGLSKAFLEFMKKFKVKQSGDGVNQFLSKRQFMKDMVGNTEKNKRARELAMLKEAMEDARKKGGYQFKDIDVDKDIRPIFDQSKDRTINSDGGRIGYADGTPDKKGILDMIDIQASGSKSGKQQIPGAPEGITIDSESLNAIAKADIPISQKVDLILEYKYGKGRDRIEDKGQEIFLDEGGYKDQDIGFGYNLGGEGFSGSVMRDLRTGDDDFKIRFLKRFANGGRIGLKAGMTKRAFLKLMGGVGAGIAGLKSGLLGIGKGAATKQVAKEAVEQGIRSTPPPYFFELASKIKTLGKPDKVTYADRVEIHRYTGKNGDEYELIEDLNTGDMRIQKDKMGGANFGDESYEVIDDRTVLEYRKGDVNVKDEGLETQSSFKEADEYEEYKVEFDQDGTEAGADEIAANVQKEIVEEAGGEAPSIKKAGGGIARMLGE